MKNLDQWIGRIDRGFLYCTGTGLMTIMLVIVVDVVLRYLFSAPLSWSHDLISMYLVTLTFFLALGDTFRRGGHIKVDLFESLRGSRLFNIAAIAGYALSMLLFCLIVQQMVVSGWEAFIEADVVDGAIPWPTWPPYLLGTLGVGLLIVRIFLGIISRLLALAAGTAFHEEGSGHSSMEHVE